MDFLDRMRDMQQFHLTNIFIQYIKNYLYIIIYSKIALSLIESTAEKSACSSGGHYYIVIIENGSLCFILFNLIALFYITRQDHFARLEFFIMYGLNLAWFGIMLFYSLFSVLAQAEECASVIIFRKAFLFVCIKKELEIGALIFRQSDGFLRQVNICANTVFAFMIFTSPNQEKCSPAAASIALTITLENVLSLLFFSAINISITWFSLHNQSFKAIRFASFVILCTFVVTYIVILYFNVTNEIPFQSYCVPLIFAMNSYSYVIPISVVSMAILYYSLLMQYQAEVEENEKNNSVQRSNDPSHGGTTTGNAIGFGTMSSQRKSIALSPFDVLEGTRNEKYVENQQKLQSGNPESATRNSVSSHRDLEKLYRSGQLKNKDEIIDDNAYFEAHQSSTNHLFHQKNSHNNNNTSSHPQQQGGFYGFTPAVYQAQNYVNLHQNPADIGTNTFLQQQRNLQSIIVPTTQAQHAHTATASFPEDHNMKTPEKKRNNVNFK